MMPILLILLLLVLPGLAQEQYDNLTVVGASPTLTDEENTQLTLYAMRTKYKEPVVGMYFVNGDKQVRFYMNSVTWEKVKRDLLKAKAQWSNLAPLEFETGGSVQGYQIANKLATLRLSLQGATQLSSKRLMLSASGGAESIQHLDISLQEEGLEELIVNLKKVDQFFAGAATK